MSDQDRRTKVVSLAVYPDTKEKWENAADEDPNADSLSQLVRVAVNRYLYKQDKNGSSDIQDEMHEQLTTLTTQQNELAGQIDEIKGQLTDIRNAVTGSNVGSEIEALADDLFQALPTETDIRTQPPISDLSDEDGVPAPEPGTVEWLSEQIDASTSRYQLQTALNYLHQEAAIHTVQQTDDGQYYKDV